MGLPRRSPTSFDLDYRSKLSSPAAASATVAELAPDVDAFVVAERDVETVLERRGSSREPAAALASEYDFETVIVTRSERGAVAVPDGDAFEQSVYPASDAHSVGSGDAFGGGFLARRLRGDSGAAPCRRRWRTAPPPLR